MKTADGDAFCAQPVRPAAMSLASRTGAAPGVQALSHLPGIDKRWLATRGVSHGLPGHLCTQL